MSQEVEATGICNYYRCERGIEQLGSSFVFFFLLLFPMKVFREHSHTNNALVEARGSPDPQPLETALQVQRVHCNHDNLVGGNDTEKVSEREQSNTACYSLQVVRTCTQGGMGMELTCTC